MKKTITKLVVGIALMGTSMIAQTPSWQWADGAGGTDNEAGMGVAVDAAGNTYVTGSYLSASITFGTTTLTNSGGIDFYLVKYDASGNVVWAKGATGASNDVGYNLTVDAVGNTYIVGTTNSALLTIGIYGLAASGYDDIFITKFDASGNTVWAKRVGGSGNDIGQNISIDANGNSYITGYYASPSITFGSTTLTNVGGNDIFVVKYDASGNVAWAETAGGSSNENGMGIATDVGGNTYVTGQFQSSSLTFGATTLTNSGGDDYFIVKYNSSGTVVWAKGATGASNDVGYNVKVDNNKNPIVVGSFNSSSLTFGTHVLSLVSNDDIFILKYDSLGNVQWAKSAGGSGNDIGESIAIDASGNSYITGYFGSPTLVFGSTTLTNAGTNNIYLASYDASGNPTWAKGAGGTSDDRGTAIDVDVEGSSYITGYYTSSTITFGTNTLTNGGANDMYVAKYGTPFTTGITEIKVNNIDTKLYPNPNNGSFVIETNNSAKQTMNIYDVNGKLVLSQTISSKTIIDASSLNEGVYNINIISNEDTANKRLVIVK